MSMIEFFIALIVLTLLTKIFQPSVVFHIEANHLIWDANQTTGFYMKYNTEQE